MLVNNQIKEHMKNQHSDPHADERIVPGAWGDGRHERYALRHDAIAVIRPPVRTEGGHVLAGYLLCRMCEAQFAFTDKVNSYYAAFDAFLAHTCKKKS